MQSGYAKLFTSLFLFNILMFKYKWQDDLQLELKDAMLLSDVFTEEQRKGPQT